MYVTCCLLDACELWMHTDVTFCFNIDFQIEDELQFKLLEGLQDRDKRDEWNDLQEEVSANYLDD